MHVHSNTEFWDLNPRLTKLFQKCSSNRIKIQVILLIPQLETDYFSSYSFQKCTIRSSGTTVFTETSRTAILHEEVLQILQLQFYKGIHIQATYTCIQRILHPESNSTRKTKSSLSTITTCRGQRDLHSRIQKKNSTHRRQGDLLKMHLCVLQDLPKAFQSFQTFHLFQTLQRHSGHSSHSWPSSLSRQFYNSTKFQVSPGNPTHYSILQLECIFYKFYRFYSSMVSTENSTKYQLNNTNYKHSTNITFFKEREMLRYRSELTDSPE